MAQLEMIAGPEPGRVFTLSDQRQNVIGRALPCNIMLRDTTVSRYHAHIFQRQGQWYVDDLRSLNETRVDRAPVAWRRMLTDRDTVVLGRVVLRFSLQPLTPSRKSGAFATLWLTSWASRLPR